MKKGFIRHDDASHDIAYHSPKRRRILKIVQFGLPVFAGLILLAVLVWPSAQGYLQPQNSQQVSSAAQDNTIQNELIKPRFQSMDQQERPYTITADKAIQNHDNPDMITLYSPLADMMVSQGEWIAINAQRGEYEQAARILDLHQDVSVYHDSGYLLQSETLTLNFNNTGAQTRDKVYIQGPQGTLNAEGLTANQDNGTVLFHGPATMTIIETDSSLLP